MVSKMAETFRDISTKEAVEFLRRGESLIGFRVSGPLVLEGVFPFSIRVENCCIDEIHAEGCVFDGDFSLSNLSGASLKGVWLDHAEVGGVMEWINVEVDGPVSLVGVDIGGECKMDDLNLKYIEFRNARLAGRASFSHTHFEEFADFSKMNFGGQIDFGNAFFGHGADFSGAKFEGDVRIEKANFKRTVYFNKAEFHGNTDFDRCCFLEHADFRRTRFVGQLDFKGASCHLGVHFNHAHFEKWCDFNESTFHRFNGPDVQADGEFLFRQVKVIESTNLEGMAVNGTSDFSGVTIGGDARFAGGRFHEANFFAAQFSGMVDFSEAVFRGLVDFRDAYFEKIICLSASFPMGATINWRQVEGHIHHCQENAHSEACDEYGQLKVIFESNNDYDSMDRAYEMFRYHENFSAERNSFSRVLNTWVLCYCAGYGTRPGRLFVFSMGIIVIFAGLYAVLGGQIQYHPDGEFAPSFYLYFSLMTFVSAGVDGIHPEKDGWLMAVVALETFLGILLMTLFAVMLGRKWVR
tara:strand:- start:286 stop:1854 length:1569 start_codon:yes stop_codon:yes gene_type:complete